MAENIAAPLQSEGNATQAVIQPAISGSEVARIGQQVPNALRDIASGLNTASQDVARGLSAQVSQSSQQSGLQAGVASVTRDETGKIVVQPSAPNLFGIGGQDYADAVHKGAVAQASQFVQEDLTKMHIANAGNPEGFKTAADGYIQGLTPTLGSGQTGFSIVQEAKQRAGEIYNGLVLKKGATDIQNSGSVIQGNIASTFNDLVGLAKGGQADSDEYKQKFASLTQQYGALSANPAFGFSRDTADLELKDKTIQLQGATIVGHMDSAYKAGGEDAARKQLHDSIDGLQGGISEANKATLTRYGEARLSYLKGQDQDATKTLQTDFAAVVHLADHGNAVGPATWQRFIDRASELGDTDTVNAATAAMAAHPIIRATQGLTPGQIDAAHGVGAPNATSDRIHAAIIQQESGGNPNAATSVTGAQGIGQIQPATFAQYARPGESIVRASDNLAVSKRIIDDYTQRYNGDASRVAVAYFSGPGNVAPPGSATPWITNKADPNGKTTASYVADVAKRLGGGGDQSGGGTAVSVNGKTFSEADLAANPMLSSTLVKAQAGDAGNRERAGKALMDGIERGLNNNLMPSVSNLAMAAQLAETTPQLVERFDKIKEGVAGVTAAQQSFAPGAGGQALIDAAMVKANGGDLYEQGTAIRTLEARNSIASGLKENPARTAAQQGWTQGIPAPIDYSDGQSIAGGIAARGQVAQAIGTRLGAPQSAIFPQDADGIKAALSNGPAAAGAVILGSIAQLPADIRAATIASDDVKGGVLAMTRSGDPAKMNVGYQFLDQQYRANPMTFEKQFGEGALSDLRAWQDKISFEPPAKIAQDAMKADDPGTIRAKDALRSQADESMKTVTGKDIVNKFMPIWQRWNPLGADYMPAGEEPGLIVGALRSDYQLAYREQFAKTSDAGAADKYAMEKVSLKWGPSDANGGRVMAWAPETSPAYPAINGDKSWIKSQLAEDVHQKIVQSTQGPDEQGKQLAMQRAPYALVPDQQTESEITSGRAPSYQVMVQGENGRMSMLGRWAADPTRAQAKAAAGFTQQQQINQQMMANAPPPGAL